MMARTWWYMAGLSGINLCVILVLMSRTQAQRITGHKKENRRLGGAIREPESNQNLSHFNNFQSIYEEYINWHIKKINPFLVEVFQLDTLCFIFNNRLKKSNHQVPIKCHGLSTG